HRHPETRARRLRRGCSGVGRHVPGLDLGPRGAGVGGVPIGRPAHAAPGRDPGAGAGGMVVGFVPDREGVMMAYFDHDIYEDGDADAPDRVKDRNGDVVLHVCRRCGKTQVELYGACTPKPADVVVVPRDLYDDLRAMLETLIDEVAIHY